MDFMNQMFRAELERFQGADEATRMGVVQAVADAGQDALEWLVELCNDEPMLEVAYGDLARRLRGG